MMNIKVSDIRDVGEILDYVHDRVFQLSDIHFDRENALLSIPLTVVTDALTDQRTYLFFSTWKNPVVESELVIRSVTDCAVKDEAQTGEANINTIAAEDDSLVIKCSVPVEIKATVSTVDLELVLSNKVVGKVSRFSFGSPPNTEHT